MEGYREEADSESHHHHHHCSHEDPNPSSHLNRATDPDWDDERRLFLKVVATFRTYKYKFRVQSNSKQFDEATLGCILISTNVLII
jgi:hypothetical protein